MWFYLQLTCNRLPEHFSMLLNFLWVIYGCGKCGHEQELDLLECLTLDDLVNDELTWNGVIDFAGLKFVKAISFGSC